MIRRLFTGLIAPALFASAGLAALPAQADEDRPPLFSKPVASALFGGTTAPWDRRVLSWGTRDGGDPDYQNLPAPRDRNVTARAPYLWGGQNTLRGQALPQRR